MHESTTPIKDLPLERMTREQVQARVLPVIDSIKQINTTSSDGLYKLVDALTNKNLIGFAVKEFEDRVELEGNFGSKDENQIFDKLNSIEVDNISITSEPFHGKITEHDQTTLMSSFDTNRVVITIKK